MSLISRLHHVFQGTHENEYDGTIMEFEDPEVKKYLVENIGGENGITNPDFGIEGVKGIAGEVTYVQVLACKKVDFQGNRNIRRFNELEYFKNLTEVHFRRSSIEEVSLPYMTINEGYNFQQCTSLKKLTTRYGLKINYASNMFNGCSSLQSLDTSNWNLSNLTNCDSMFYDCTNLVSIDLSDKLENCRSYIYTFYGCTNLESIVGNHTETDNVRLFIGYDGGSYEIYMEFFSNPKINLATINALIRGVASPYGRKITLHLPEPVKSQVTKEYRKILEYKNWVIS